MLEPAFEVVLRIANRQITEHLSWDDLLSLSRSSTQVKYVILNYCAPFEGDIVRMSGYGGGSGDGGPSIEHTQALRQLQQLPVAARLFITSVPQSANRKLAEAIEACGRVNHISYMGGGLRDLINRLSPAAADRIISLDLVSDTPDASRLTNLTRLEIHGGGFDVMSFMRRLPNPEKLRAIYPSWSDTVMGSLREIGFVNLKPISFRQVVGYAGRRIPFHSRYDCNVDVPRKVVPQSSSQSQSQNSSSGTSRGLSFCPLT